MKDFDIQFIGVKYEYDVKNVVFDELVEKISCGVNFGKWEGRVARMVNYPACADRQDLIVNEEYKDELFINVCNLYMTMIF